MNEYFKLSFGISFLLHLLLSLAIIMTSAERSHYISFAPVYQVKLVSLPHLKPAPAPHKGTNVKVSSSQHHTKVSKSVVKKKASNTSIPITHKINHKKAIVLKKSTKKIKPENLLPAPVERRILEIKKELMAKKRQEQLKQQVAQIAKEIKSSVVTGSPSTGEISTAQAPQQGNAHISPAFQIYYSEIFKKIRNNWVLPEFLIKNGNALEAIVIVKIDREGNIVSFKFEKHSGNGLFDQSVIEAIKKANPLPPLPKDYIQPYHEVGIRFRWSLNQKEIS